PSSALACGGDTSAQGHLPRRQRRASARVCTSDLRGTADHDMATLKQSLLRRLAKSESGAELIEFALTLPLLLLLVLGIIEFGFMFQEYEVLTNAAREGARIAVLPTYGATDTARKNNAAARID